MKLNPWRRPSSLPPGGQDDIWNRIREALGVPFASFESRLPELFRKSAFPLVNVSETETHFTVTAELPGLDEADIDVQVMGDDLVLSGERKWHAEKSEHEFHQIESQYGFFRRAIPLPPGLVTDSDAVRAKYAKGVLEIAFPKLEPTPPRRIAVDGGG